MNQKEYQMKVNAVTRNVIQTIDSYQLLDANQVNTVRKMLLTSLDSNFMSIIGDSNGTYQNRRRDRY